MLKSTNSLIPKVVCLACIFLLAACSPKYNWREVRGTTAPFVVTLPAKPASHARQVDLDGLKVTMTMTAAEVDDVTFAVGSVELSDPSQAQQALLAMKTALVRNINGEVRHEQSSTAGTTPFVIEIEAGSPPDRRGRSRLLLGHFIAKEQRAYQVIVVGDEKNVSREAAETFFTSFKPY